MCLTVCLIQCSAGGTDGAAESRPQQRNGPDGEVHHSHYPRPEQDKPGHFYPLAHFRLVFLFGFFSSPDGQGAYLALNE